MWMWMWMCGCNVKMVRRRRRRSKFTVSHIAYRISLEPPGTNTGSTGYIVIYSIAIRTTVVPARKDLPNYVSLVPAALGP
jgi:hypothetical protein